MPAAGSRWRSTPCAANVHRRQRSRYAGSSEFVLWNRFWGEEQRHRFPAGGVPGDVRRLSESLACERASRERASTRGSRRLDDRDGTVRSADDAGGGSGTSRSPRRGLDGQAGVRDQSGGPRPCRRGEERREFLWSTGGSGARARTSAFTGRRRPGRTVIETSTRNVLAQLSETAPSDGGGLVGGSGPRPHHVANIARGVRRRSAWVSAGDPPRAAAGARDRLVVGALGSLFETAGVVGAAAVLGARGSRASSGDATRGHRDRSVSFRHRKRKTLARRTLSKL